MSFAAETKDSDKVAEVLNASLRTTPFELFLSEHQPYEQTLARYKNRIKEFSESGATLLQANDFNSVAVWFPPNYTPPPSPLEANERFQQFKTRLEEIIKKHGLDKRPHWELMFIGKDPKENKGSIKPLILPHLQKAKSDGIPAVLSAITEHAKLVYLHLGFEELGSLRVGEGEVNDKGEEDENGQGLKVCLMAYNFVR